MKRLIRSLRLTMISTQKTWKPTFCETNEPLFVRTSTELWTFCYPLPLLLN